MFTKSGGDRRHAPNVAIVLTDGKSTYNSNLTVPEAKRTRDAGIQLYVIGVTPDGSIEEIRNISSPPQRINVTYALVQNFAALDNVTMIIEFAKQICRWDYMVRGK